jgi:hypothetical protein
VVSKLANIDPGRNRLVPSLANNWCRHTRTKPDGVTAVDVHLRLAHPAEAPDPYNRTLRTAR